jgi:hypothetical protein
MTKFALVIVIALGVLLGQIAWELLGLLVEWSGKLVGWVIAQSMQRMIAARQAEAERNAAALARQRPPLVTETGGRVDETLQR